MWESRGEIERGEMERKQMRLDENIKSMYTIINNIHLSKCDKAH